MFELQQLWEDMGKSGPDRERAASTGTQDGNKPGVVLGAIKQARMAGGQRGERC